MYIQKRLLGNKRFLFILGLIVLGFLFAAVKNVEQFHYDADYYWELGASFWGNGFSFLNYPVSIRGYFFPLVLGLSQKLSVLLFRNPFIVFRLLNSILLVTLLTVLIPGLFDMHVKTVRFYIGSCLMLVLFLYFWRELLLCSLSDMPALWMYVAVMFLLKKILHAEKRITRFVLSFLSGIVTYGAYNTRTVYLYPLVLIWGIFLVYNICKKKAENILWIVFAAIGVIIAGAPQLIINVNHGLGYSMAVDTPYSGSSSLAVAQLFMGIKYPRYETYIGDKSVFPNASVFFTSQLGEQIYPAECALTLSNYIAWLFRNFWVACGLYAEHLVSGFTLFWREVYLTDIHTSLWCFLLNCATFLTALLGAMSMQGNVVKKWNGAHIVSLLLVLLPVAMALFGAVEVRFFLPVYLMVYTYLSYVMDYKAAVAYVKEKPIQVILVLGIVFLIWCMAANHLLSSIYVGELTLDGRYFPAS